MICIFEVAGCLSSLYPVRGRSSVLFSQVTGVFFVRYSVAIEICHMTIL